MSPSIFQKMKSDQALVPIRDSSLEAPLRVNRNLQLELGSSAVFTQVNEMQNRLEPQNRERFEVNSV